MYICDSSFCDFIVYNINYDDILILKMERDEKVINEIKEKCAEFIEKMQKVIKK
jgi:uncharacterized spore protein YtfJ